MQRGQRLASARTASRQRGQAFVVFLIAKSFVKEAPVAPTRECQFCGETILAVASRCPRCTSELVQS